MPQLTFSPQFSGTVIISKRSHPSANNSSLINRMSVPDSYTDNAGRFRAFTNTQNMDDDLKMFQEAKQEGRRSFFFPQNLTPNALHPLLERLSHLDALDELVTVTDPQQQRRREILMNRLFDYIIENAKQYADLLTCYHQTRQSK
jgi:hypothetical protein